MPHFLLTLEVGHLLSCLFRSRSTGNPFAHVIGSRTPLIRKGEEGPSSKVWSSSLHVNLNRKACLVLEEQRVRFVHVANSKMPLFRGGGADLPGISLDQAVVFKLPSTIYESAHRMKACFIIQFK